MRRPSAKMQDIMQERYLTKTQINDLLEQTKQRSRDLGVLVEVSYPVLTDWGEKTATRAITVLPDGRVISSLITR